MIGGVVARGGLARLDHLLEGHHGIALLLSPQGVVFASNRQDWMSRLAGKPTPERLADIRSLKQFGTLFDGKDPEPLPLVIEPGLHDLEGRTHAVAARRIEWNDPSGPWTLVLAEDLSATLTPTQRLTISAVAGLLVLLALLLIRKTLISQYAERNSARQLEADAQAKTEAGRRKALLAQAALRFQQAEDAETLAEAFLAVAHDLHGALQGTVYLAENVATTEPVLRLAANYATTEDVPTELAPGEGLLGQCLLERCRLLIPTPQDETWQIRSGLGSTSPGALLLAPVLLRERAMGTVELALLHVLEEAERARAEQLAFQQTLVDTIPYPVFYKGPDTRFLGFNRAYEHTFAVRREDLIGKRVLDLDYLPEADRLAYQAEDETTIASAGTVEREMRIPFADGRTHDTLYFVTGFRHPDGLSAGLVGTFIDITQMKDAERESERLADIERFNQLALGREERILELKREINALAEAAGQKAPYVTSLVQTVGDHAYTPHTDYRLDLVDASRPLRLEELVDLDELQSLFTRFCESVGIAAAIIDLEAKVLASSRWQRACTDFHRANPESYARCIESDTQLALKLQDGMDYTMYTCKNGMTDAASPIIIEGQHLANVFIGQFHLRPPDLEFFRHQARQFGYDEGDYLKAVAEAPVADEKKLPVILGFLTGFARLISTMSLARRWADAAQKTLQHQAEMLQRERIAALSLAEDAQRAHQALESLAKESTT